MHVKAVFRQTDRQTETQVHVLSCAFAAKNFRIPKYQSNIANGLEYDMKSMVWKFENYIFKWCYKLSRLSDPPLTPFKYWLPGQTISTLATRSSLAAVHSNEPKYNNPGQAAAASLRICKRCKCPVLMVTAETSISDKLTTTAGIW